MELNDRLLRLARDAIRTTLTGEELAFEDLGPGADAQRACFVTLTKHGRLRGCIGSLVAHQPLSKDVIEHARNAAFRDPRFPPVTAEELPQLCIELSILTAPEPCAFDPSHPEALVGKGVTISARGRRATFLPQVWEQLSDPEEFLTELCLKAGLAPDEWRRGTLVVEMYTAEKCSEPERGVADDT